MKKHTIVFETTLSENDLHELLCLMIHEGMFKHKNRIIQDFVKTNVIKIVDIIHPDNQ